MFDLDHWYGEDLIISSVGDVGVIDGATKTKQRIIRALLTNPATQEEEPDYLWHPDYGLGVGRYVGDTKSRLEELRSKIQAYVLQDPGVASDPIPVVEIESTDNVLNVRIKYKDVSTGGLEEVNFNTGN